MGPITKQIIRSTNRNPKLGTFALITTINNVSVTSIIIFYFWGTEISALSVMVRIAWIMMR